MFSEASVNVSGYFFFFRMGEFSGTFALYALPCQTPFYQTAPVLSSVTQQQNVKGYWWEGSTSIDISPISASDVMGKHNKIGGITFRAVLIK